MYSLMEDAFSVLWNENSPLPVSVRGECRPLTATLFMELDISLSFRGVVGNVVVRPFSWRKNSILDTR